MEGDRWHFKAEERVDEYFISRLGGILKCRIAFSLQFGSIHGVVAVVAVVDMEKKSERLKIDKSASHRGGRVLLCSCSICTESD